MNVKFTAAQRRIFIACFLSYACAYIGRLNLSAALNSVIGDMNLTDAQGGLFQTVFALTYAAGQLVNGSIVDKISARVYIFLGLALSGVALPQGRSNAAVTAMQGDGVQTLRTEIDFGSYPSVRVQAGVPVEWTIVVPDGKLNGCNGELRIPAFDLDVVLHEGDNPVTFLPETAGTFPYSCWMGMIHATIEVTP